MAAAETIWIRGQGGAVLGLQPPLEAGIADRIERGLIARVTPGGPSRTGVEPVPAAPAEEAPAVPPTEPTADTESDVAQPEPPARSARKAEWVQYAVSVSDLTADEAAALNRDDLIERFG